ncbi:MAG: GTP 3',8-cyclase MoaA [Spirochaetota bacterium]
MLKDNFLRNHNYLRVSVTDKCNLRCRYCMPPEGVEFLPHDKILRNEDFARIIGLFINMGINKVRFTGGEPLVRNGIIDIISTARSFSPNVELCLTTNGILLNQYADDLQKQGVKRINISLDTMSRSRFLDLTGRDYFDTVVSNIEKSIGSNFFNVKINTVLFSHTLEELDDFLDYFMDKNITLRFIERMPVTEQDELNSFVPSDELIQALKSKGKLTPVIKEASDVAMRYDIEYKNRKIKLGIIPPVTHRFCASCNRLRITAEGNLRTCLYSNINYNLKEMLDRKANDNELEKYIAKAIKEKQHGHNIECTADNKGCRSITCDIKAMSKIGG